MHLLRRHLREPFNLSLINIGATNFKQEGGRGSDANILQLFSRHASRHAGNSNGAATAGLAPITSGLDYNNGASSRQAVASAADRALVHNMSCGEEHSEELSSDCSLEDQLAEEGAAAVDVNWDFGSLRVQQPDGGGSSSGLQGPAALVAVSSDGGAQRVAERSAALRRNYGSSDSVRVGSVSSERRCVSLLVFRRLAAGDTRS